MPTTLSSPPIGGLLIKNCKHALLVANGDAQSNLSALFQPSDFIIAVDGGLRHLRSLDRFPDLLLGDLDSITPEELQACQNHGVEILRFNPQKDESDLELAILEALRRGFDCLTISNASGGRADHFLSNLALLFHPALQNTRVILRDNTSLIYPVSQDFTLTVQPGDLISLIPWGGAAFGVRTSNLAYPLDGETLLPHQSRGLSNVALGDQISIHLQSGKLLLVHTPKK